MIGSDGYTYASIADRLLGERENTQRNANLAFLRQTGASEDEARAYCGAYDAAKPYGSHFQKDREAYNAYNAIRAAKSATPQPR